MVGPGSCFRRPGTDYGLGPFASAKELKQKPMRCGHFTITHRSNNNDNKKSTFRFRSSSVFILSININIKATGLRPSYSTQDHPTVHMPLTANLHWGPHQLESSKEFLFLHSFVFAIYRTFLSFFCLDCPLLPATYWHSFITLYNSCQGLY